MTVSERTYQAIIGVLVLALLVGAWWMFGTQRSAVQDTTASGSTQLSGTTPNEDTASSGSMTGGMTVSGDAVSVGDQPAGSFVVVGSATVPQMGWVAVRDSSGRVLGAARVEAGTHQAVQVELLRNTVAGEMYQVLVYVDDGDKVFDLHKDTLVMNADGAVSGAMFSALHGD